VAAADGLTAVALVHAVYLSSVLGQPVGVAQVLDGAHDGAILNGLR
jgi:hypothetical protein